MRTVLIVEDEWAIADWLEVLLSEYAYNVLVAGNGREALDILHRETPDLVLTDFMMPFVDGAGLIAAMARGRTAARDSRGGDDVAAGARGARPRRALSAPICASRFARPI